MVITINELGVDGNRIIFSRTTRMIFYLFLGNFSLLNTSIHSKNRLAHLIVATAIGGTAHQMHFAYNATYNNFSPTIPLVFAHFSEVFRHKTLIQSKTPLHGPTTSRR